MIHTLLSTRTSANPSKSFSGPVLGFANFFRSLDENATLPLMEFALGIELAQLLIVLIALTVGYLAKNILKANARDWTIALCCITIGMLVQMLTDTWPF